jgi:hypothetical protein
MSIVHVYPTKGRLHNTQGGGCWCEPEIIDSGLDSDLKPARVFVHSGDWCDKFKVK